MQENGERSTPSVGDDEKPENSAPADSILPMHKFPASAAAETASQRQAVVPKKPKGRLPVGVILVMVVLPTTLFVAVIAGLAWFTQYLPNWRTVDDGGFDYSKPIVQIPHNLNVAQWERNVYDYTTYRRATKEEKPKLPPPPVLEIERGWKGYYDFFFFNDSSVAGEIGLQKISCDCSTVKICVLPKHEAKAHFDEQRRRGKWTEIPDEDPGFGWQALQKSASNGVTVPPGKGGLIRLTWQARKDEGVKLNLRLEFWTQPKGLPHYRLETPNLVAPVAVLPPITVFPPSLNFGRLTSKKKVTKSFACWSATQDEFQVKFPKNKENPCIQCKAEKLSNEDYKSAKELVRNMRGYKGRIRSGYKVTVTLTEEKDGRQLDIGSIFQHVPVRFIVNDEAVISKPPVIQALVVSDIRVARAQDNIINLGNFSSQYRHKKSVTLTAPRGTTLKRLSHKPAFLSVDLAEKKSSKSQVEWEVTVTVPAGRQIGPLPQGSILKLESIKSDGKKRTVRIPIVGTALRN